MIGVEDEDMLVFVGRRGRYRQQGQDQESRRKHLVKPHVQNHTGDFSVVPV